MHVKRFKKQLAMLLYQKKDLQMANCILATSQMEAHNVRNLGIYSPVAVIPNGIDITEYKCRGEIEKYSIKKQILFLSRIDPKKGIEYLIEAWKILKSQYRDWNVIIVGNGEESYILRLKTLISKYGLEECIRILPPAFGEDKYKLYCESSLFVLPTYSENFGMVIAEAMSCGVPVITTNGTPWHELNTKKLGWCIDLSLNNLIKSISEAIDLGQDRLFELGQLSSRHVYENYQYNEVANRMISVYKWVINGDSTQGDVDFNLILGG
jgi:glycosyltransferase involved in cell wall biosynthesis